MSDSDQDEEFFFNSSDDEEEGRTVGSAQGSRERKKYHPHDHDATRHHHYTNLYARLGVKPDVDEKAIRKAYHHQSSLYHSDKMNLDKAAATDRHEIHTRQHAEKKNNKVGKEVGLKPTTVDDIDDDGDDETSEERKMKKGGDEQQDAAATAAPEAVTAATVADLEALMRERFQKINEAYQILSDPRSRAAYDHRGMKKGVERLSLVPAHFTTPDAIASALDALDYELEAKRTAKLVGSHGSLTLCLNWLDLGWAYRPKQRSGQQQVPQHPPALAPEYSEVDSEPADSGNSQDQSQEHQQPAEGGDSAAAAMTETPSEEQSAAAAGSSSSSPAAPQLEGGPEGERDQDHGQPGVNQPMQMQGQVKKANVDGKECFIIIPGPEVQEMMEQQHRSTMLKKQQQGGSGAADGDEEERHQEAGVTKKRNNGLGINRLWHSLAKYTTPYQIQIVHGMILPVSKNVMKTATVTIKTTLSQAKQGGASEFRATLRSVRSHCSTISVMLLTSVGSLKCSLRQIRTLSLKWTLTNTISLIEQGRLLSRYTVKLRRQLSRHTTMSMNWSLSYLPSGGYLNLELAKVSDLQGLFSKSLSLTMSPGGGLNAYFSRQSVVYFRKGKKNEKKITLTQQVSTDAFNGATTIAYDALVPVSKMRKFGLGVSTTFPLALSPMAPPFFLISPQQWSLSTQFMIILQQSDHRMVIPILISGNPNLFIGIQFCAAPWIIYRLGRRFGAPVLAVWEARKAREARRAKAAELLEARDQALQEQSALKESVDARRAAEGSKGLVIINATYQLLNSSSSTSASTKRSGGGGGGEYTTNNANNNKNREPVATSLDVTIPLQSLVQHSELCLPEGSSRPQLTGFYNLDPNADPSDVVLDITYWFAGERHNVVVDDTEAVQLPQVEHQILS